MGEYLEGLKSNLELRTLAYEALRRGEKVDPVAILDITGWPEQDERNGGAALLAEFSKPT